MTIAKNFCLISGGQSRFDNRVTWARTYLTKAGLLEQPGRGRFRISERGPELLATNPPTLTISDLERFASFVDFRNQPVAASSDDQPVMEVSDEVETTPQEQLADAYSRLRRTLAEELLLRISTMSPSSFEKLVVELIVAMGYGGSLKDAGEAVGGSHDGGIDGTIKEDKLGLDVVYIQAKRWATPVGRPEVQAFAGSLEGVRARKGILITTSQFTGTAKEYVSHIEKKIVLIDGDRLTQYMIDYGIAVTSVDTYVVNKIDDDYFED